MGAWSHRVAKDDKGKLHFVFARYDAAEPWVRCGLIPAIALNEADTVDGLRQLARSLLRACDQPIISMAEREVEPHDEDDDDDEPGNPW